VDEAVPAARQRSHELGRHDLTPGRQRNPAGPVAGMPLSRTQRNPCDLHPDWSRGGTTREMAIGLSSPRSNEAPGKLRCSTVRAGSITRSERTGVGFGQAAVRGITTRLSPRACPIGLLQPYHILRRIEQQPRLGRLGRQRNILHDSASAAKPDVTANIELLFRYSQGFSGVKARIFRSKSQVHGFL
jgi:hypothetical protein